MADTNTENTNQSTPRGFSIHTETIAKGALRIKTKLWVDHLNLTTGISEAIDLYDKTVKQFRERGYKIDGDL